MDIHRLNKSLFGFACILSSIILFILIIFAYYCFELYFYKKYCPSMQRNTEWVSEDGLIRFSVPQDGLATGVLHTEEGDVNVIVGFDVCELLIAVAENSFNDALLDAKILENWNGNHFRKNKFTVTIEETTFFKKGDKIKFYKVE